LKSIEAGCDMILVCNDYDGTMDVIDALEKNDVQMLAKIKDLKNSADINWNDLENQDRVKEIKSLIKEMGRT
jgi:beta-glucosidase-like glycosyl hydrolase